MNRRAFLQVLGLGAAGAAIAAAAPGIAAIWTPKRTHFLAPSAGWHSDDVVRRLRAALDDPNGPFRPHSLMEAIRQADADIRSVMGIYEPLVRAARPELAANRVNTFVQQCVNAQRAYNRINAELVEAIALAPRAPWLRAL